MNKRDALKLNPGEWIAFGNSMWSKNVSRWRRGKVIHVTPSGGIKVQTASGVEWVPYHHVHQGIDADDPYFGHSGTTVGD